MANKSHYFHAEAHALTGKLDLPFKEEIKKQAFVKLEGRLADLSEEEQAMRNYFSQHSKNFRLEGIISYAAAHTQVTGHKSNKHKDASMTLATSVVEDLNVLNVVTADRVVAQISTTHFKNEYSPRVTFLGTHFENLRIARHRAEPFLNPALVGERPVGEKALYVAEGTRLMDAAENQYKRLKAWLGKLSDEDRAGIPSVTDGSLAKKYYGDASDVANITIAVGKARDEDLNGLDGKSDGITCSLVENVQIEPIHATNADGVKVPIPLPGKSFGHVIHIPDFGTIFLAELTVNHNSFNLTMIRLELGCLAAGTLGAGVVNVNGGTGGGH